MGKIPVIDEDKFDDEIGRDPNRQKGEGLWKLLAGIGGGILLLNLMERAGGDPFIKDFIEFVSGAVAAGIATHKIIQKAKDKKGS
ncbi:hypothetical protein HC823_00085 [Candidatus Gracilibacteria bacterium]|nr:hypothetical protein [Candidatus Gracilibacteria bacterium]